MSEHLKVAGGDKKVAPGVLFREEQFHPRLLVSVPGELLYVQNSISCMAARQNPLENS